MGLDHVIARQAGVISARQAVGAGMSARTVQRRVATGAWTALHPRVYLVGGHRRTPQAQVWAAWLRAGERATVSGTAAAYWHGLLPRPPQAVEVTVPRALHLRRERGIRFRRRDLAERDRVHLRGLCLTALPLTVLEAALVLPEASAFLDRALQCRVGFPQVYRAWCDGMGTRGWSRARALLVAAADRADSAAERRLVDLLRAAGIAGWVLGHPFSPWALDVAFPDLRVAIEVDGWAWHVAADRFQADRRKQNALVAAGWVVLRFTWHDLVERPAAVVAQIRAVLDAAA